MVWMLGGNSSQDAGGFFLLRSGEQGIGQIELYVGVVWSGAQLCLQFRDRLGGTRKANERRSHFVMSLRNIGFELQRFSVSKKSVFVVLKDAVQISNREQQFCGHLHGAQPIEN